MLIAHAEITLLWRDNEIIDYSTDLVSMILELVIEILESIVNFPISMFLYYHYSQKALKITSIVIGLRTV
jgi:hypothetical protein